MIEDIDPLNEGSHLRGPLIGEMAWISAVVNPELMFAYFLQIVTKSSARFTGEYRYGISLCDHSSKKYYVNIANQLVATKKAKLSSSRLQVFESIQISLIQISSIHISSIRFNV